MISFLRFSFFMFCLSVVQGCNPDPSHHAVRQRHDYQQRYLPEYLKKFYLGMPLEEFLKLDPTAKVLHSGVPSSSIAVEDFNPTPELKDVIYYFDNEGNKPLYEMVVEYQDTTVRNAVVDRLYGKPNFQENRWRIDIHESFDMLVWEHEKLLVIAGKLKVAPDSTSTR